MSGYPLLSRKPMAIAVGGKVLVRMPFPFECVPETCRRH